MQDNPLIIFGLPLALAFIMFGLGLHLKTADFQRIMAQPKAMFVGLFCQILLLPALCFGIIKIFNLPAPVAIGMMLLAASPGGTTANLYSHLFKGDVALNISLTAVNSVIAAATIPLIVNFSLAQFMGAEQYIPLQLQKTVEVIAIVITPVIIGMFVNSKFPLWSRKMDKPVKIGSALILVLLIVLILNREYHHIAAHVQTVGMAALVFNVSSLLLGYMAGKFTRLNEGQSRAIAFEVGIHNSALAMYLALAVLQNGEMAIPAALYSLIMYVTATIFGWMLTRTKTITA